MIDPRMSEHSRRQRGGSAEYGRKLRRQAELRDQIKNPPLPEYSPTLETPRVKKCLRGVSV